MYVANIIVLKQKGVKFRSIAHTRTSILFETSVSHVQAFETGSDCTYTHHSRQFFRSFPSLRPFNIHIFIWNRTTTSKLHSLIFIVMLFHYSSQIVWIFSFSPKNIVVVLYIRRAHAHNVRFLKSHVKSFSSARFSTLFLSLPYPNEQTTKPGLIINDDYHHRPRSW